MPKFIYVCVCVIFVKWFHFQHLESAYDIAVLGTDVSEGLLHSVNSL